MGELTTELVVWRDRDGYPWQVTTHWRVQSNGWNLMTGLELRCDPDAPREINQAALRGLPIRALRNAVVGRRRTGAREVPVI